MQILIPLGINLGFLLLLHFLIGKYPAAAQRSDDPRKEIREAIGLWLLLVIAVTVAVFLVPEGELEDPSVQTVLLTNVLLSPFWIFIPLFVVVRTNGWGAGDLGFRRPLSRSVMIFAIVAWGAIGVLQFIDPGFAPLPAWLVLISLYQPAFTEEFFFRGVIQGKLERALGQNKAWFYSGILFGLMHASVNFFGQQWYRHGESALNAIVLLILQIVAGWVFGIMFMKSRSLLPGFLAHYFADGRFASILYYAASALR